MTDSANQSTMALLAEQSDTLLRAQVSKVVEGSAVYTPQDIEQVKFWHLAYSRLADRWFQRAFGAAEGQALFEQLIRDADAHLQTYALDELNAEKSAEVRLGTEIVNMDPGVLSAEQMAGVLRLLVPGFIAYCHHWMVHRFGEEGRAYFDQMHSYVQRISVESKEPSHDFNGLKATLATPDSVMIGFIRRIEAVEDGAVDVTYLACPNHAAAVRLGLDPDCCSYMCGPEFRLMQELFGARVENPENFCSGAGRCVQQYSDGKAC